LTEFAWPWHAVIMRIPEERSGCITFDNVGVGGSTGVTPDTVDQMAHDAIAFISAVGLSRIDLLGFSIGSFAAQEIVLRRPLWYAAWSSRRQPRGARRACTAGLPKSLARSARRRHHRSST
jgi:pimeloyl-ACP methyl ester carboxylesterase